MQPASRSAQAVMVVLVVMIILGLIASDVAYPGAT